MVQDFGKLVAFNILTVVFEFCKICKFFPIQLQLLKLLQYLSLCSFSQDFLYTRFRQFVEHFTSVLTKISQNVSYHYEVKKSDV